MATVSFTEESGVLTTVHLPSKPPRHWNAEVLKYTLRELQQKPRVYPSFTTAFQRRVWDAIAKIPWGKTLTYKALAERIGHPKAARAVGQACGANRLLLVIPCHRVVGSNGGLGGFAFGLEWKRKLLEWEAS